MIYEKNIVTMDAYEKKLLNTFSSKDYLFIV